MPNPLPPPLPSGLWPVMLTPFRANGSIDWSAYDELVDWYVASGAAGLFAVCLSSEMFLLTPEERLQLAVRAVKRAKGRVPVVATGTLGGGAEFTHRMADTGVAAVVCLTNYFCHQGSPSTRWKQGLDRYLHRVDGSIALGLYECPQPYKWLLSPRDYGYALSTGRFRFLKDTSCRMDLITSRIKAGDRTGMRLYNANTPTLLPSLEAGGGGYSGIGANYLAPLYAWLCAHHKTDRTAAAGLHRFLTVADPLISSRYPAGAKTFLRSCGLRIQPRTRLPAIAFAEEELRMIDALRHEAQSWHRKLGLRPLSPKNL